MTTSNPTKKWRDAFIIELRLRGADGKQIGDELAQVESHCRDGGLPADDAFGDPVAYARSVVVADDGAPAFSGKEVRRLVLRVLTQTIGLMLLLDLPLALRDGRQVTFTGVDVVMVLVLTALLVLLVAQVDTVMRFVAQRSIVVVGLLGAVLFAALVGVALVAGPAASIVVLTLPAGLAAAVGAVLLVLPSVITSTSDDDAIVAPLATAPQRPAPLWLTIVLRWWVPVAGLALCALMWLFL